MLEVLCGYDGAWGLMVDGYLVPEVLRGTYLGTWVGRCFRSYYPPILHVDFWSRVVENYIAAIVSVMPSFAGYFKALRRECSRSSSSMRILLGPLTSNYKSRSAGRLGSGECTDRQQGVPASCGSPELADPEPNLEPGHITRTVEIEQSEARIHM